MVETIHPRSGHTMHSSSYTRACRPAVFVAAFAVGLVVSGTSCLSSRPNPEHCFHARGDQTCADKYGAERPYCALCGAGSETNYGCVAELPDEASCYSPCGGEASLDEDASCGELGEGDGTQDETGDGDDEPNCSSPANCLDPGAPICEVETGECVACDATQDPDAACLEADIHTPVCFAGACVECAEGKQDACGGMTPACDPDTNLCVGCSEHTQCPDSACRLGLGRCFDPAYVVHVQGDAPCDSGDGSESSPYCSIGEALSNAGSEQVIFLHTRPGPSTYYESTSVSIPLAVIGVYEADEALPRVRGAQNPAFSVSSNGVLFLSEVRVFGTIVGGVSVEGGEVWLDRCEIALNDLGLALDGGTAVVRRSQVVDNLGPSVVVDGDGMLVVENSFIGGDAIGANAIEAPAGSFTLLYTTVVAGEDNARALSCADGSASTVRNSLLASLSFDSALECPDLTISDSALEVPIGGNVGIGPLADGDMFVNFAAGDLHLAPDYPVQLETAARWRVGDPKVDIDGQARPMTDLSPDFAGADRP